MKTKNKTFTLSRFGFKFKIILAGTTTVARVIGTDYWKYQDEAKRHTGLARVHSPDKYDKSLGVLIAMKSAINKYTSDSVGEAQRELDGHRSQMKHINATLSRQITNKRLNG